MAQTKRRRQTKHRGNAAGVVESRGRTGRKPTKEEKTGKASGPATKEKRLDRAEREPTWLGAFYRAMAAAVVMLLISILVLKKPNEAIALFPIVLIAYVPISYYTDRWLWKRRMATKAKQVGKAKQADGTGSK
ncbi:MAG TPA: hypothetical protein VGI26_00085 [Solirubrobacteraceae bacterium]|jgi:hypothetical protein